MKLHSSAHPSRKLFARGMTLVEISLTLALLIGLASVVAFSLSGIDDWKLARRASVSLQSVYLAQKSYLADHPTHTVGAITSADLLPYLPSNLAGIPTIESVAGANLSITITVMPPVATLSGTIYDPSGESDDGLWDVGQH